MLQRFILILLCLVVVGAALGWVLTAPDPLSSEEVAALPSGDVKAGEQVFWAGGCTSCHAAPKSVADEKLRLAGGMEFKTPFGTFVAPNISPDPDVGIGNWDLVDFANAMKRGVSPDGAHYYPAFPYPSYGRMTNRDVADLWAFLGTLPKVSLAAAENDVPFPFNIRRGLGLWKLLYFDPQPVIDMPAGNEQLARGQYLVEALGHCGACHTPRNPLGGARTDRWLAGGPSVEGKSTIPNITPHADGIGDWSLEDIAYSLETGFTPEFDSFGSTMADVQLNTARLSSEDRMAIAAYLKQIPAVPAEK